MRFFPILTALALTGCTHWVASDQPLQTVVAPAAKPARSVRVTLRNTEQLVVLNPEIRGDSLTGTRQGCTFQPCQSREPVSIRLAEILRLETRKVNVETTAYSIIGLGGAAMLVAVAVAWRDGPFGKP